MFNEKNIEELRKTIAQKEKRLEKRELFQKKREIPMICCIDTGIVCSVLAPVLVAIAVKTNLDINAIWNIWGVITASSLVIGAPLVITSSINRDKIERAKEELKVLKEDLATKEILFQKDEDKAVNYSVIKDNSVISRDNSVIIQDKTAYKPKTLVRKKDE